MVALLAPVSATDFEALAVSAANLRNIVKKLSGEHPDQLSTETGIA